MVAEIQTEVMALETVSFIIPFILEFLELVHYDYIKVLRYSLILQQHKENTLCNGIQDYHLPSAAPLACFTIAGRGDEFLTRFIGAESDLIATIGKRKATRSVLGSVGGISPTKAVVPVNGFAREAHIFAPRARRTMESIQIPRTSIIGSIGSIIIATSGEGKTCTH